MMSNLISMNQVASKLMPNTTVMKTLSNTSDVSFVENLKDDDLNQKMVSIMDVNSEVANYLTLLHPLNKPLAQV